MEDYLVLLASLIILSLFHVSGEILYKIGGMGYDKTMNEESSIQNKNAIRYLVIIIFSLGLSMGIKVIYGILIGTNPLSVVAAVYLGLVGAYSVFFGKIIFKETIHTHQYIGFALIFSGIIFMVI